MLENGLQLHLVLGMERIHIDNPVPMSLGLKSKIDLLSTVFCIPRYDTRYDPEPVTLSLGVNTALDDIKQPTVDVLC